MGGVKRSVYIGLILVYICGAKVYIGFYVCFMPVFGWFASLIRMD
jgi:hypothetical protein